jgi:putative DNA primase/helicase
MRDAERRLWSLQAIDADGRKSFLRGGRVRAMFHVVGRDSLRGAGAEWGGTIAIAEGYATAATVHEHKQWPTAVAFGAGNLEPVALAIRQRLGKARIVITGDVGPVGQEKANEAAAAVGGFVSFPKFTPEQIAGGATDFNDLAALA